MYKTQTDYFYVNKKFWSQHEYKNFITIILKKVKSTYYDKTTFTVMSKSYSSIYSNVVD